MRGATSSNTGNQHRPASRLSLTKQRKSIDGWRLHHLRKTSVNLSGREMVASEQASNLPSNRHDHHNHGVTW